MATCSSADSVLNAATQIKSNATKLNDFVNGESDQTVQLGESTDTPTPTLRNLVANALEHVAESMGDSVETAVATINELESGKADKVSGNVEDHIAALDMYGNLQDSSIDMGNVATISVDIANLDTDKADKVSSATNGHLAGLNASGNLTDSGLASSNVALKDTDIATLQAIKADKVSGATEGHLASLDATGNLLDSGEPASAIDELRQGKADKVADAVAGNFAGLDASGNLTDSGRSPDDITALEERKADKAYWCEAGNLAKLNGEGNLLDAGRAVEDLVGMLAYADDEALELEEAVRTSIRIYKAIQEQDAEAHLAGIDEIRRAGDSAIGTRQDIEAAIDAFDEETARQRLMLRLAAGTNPGANAKPVLFVVAGQSNAVGYGRFYSPCESAANCGQFWKWGGYDEDDGYYILDPQDQALMPLADPTGNRNFGSPWPAFARQFFALTGRKVLLLNIAQGGTSVTLAAGADMSWGVDGGELQTSREGIWNAFSAAVPASSYDIGGILWNQGEAEASNLYWASDDADWAQRIANYKSSTADAWSWLRSLIGAPSCPIFVVQTVYSKEALTDARRKRAYEEIQQAQIQLLNYETVFPGFCMTPYFAISWDTYMCDNAHCGSLGYRLLGEAMGRSVVNYLSM